MLRSKGTPRPTAILRHARMDEQRYARCAEAPVEVAVDLVLSEEGKTRTCLQTSDPRGESHLRHLLHPYHAHASVCCPPGPANWVYLAPSVRFGVSQQTSHTCTVQIARVPLATCALCASCRRDDWDHIKVLKSHTSCSCSERIKLYLMNRGAVLGMETKGKLKRMSSSLHFSHLYWKWPDEALSSCRNLKWFLMVTLTYPSFTRCG